MVDLVETVNFKLELFHPDAGIENPKPARGKKMKKLNSCTGEKKKKISVRGEKKHKISVRGGKLVLSSLARHS